MKKRLLLDKKIAECVGLWLAEGDNKSRLEITFTNNCWDLVNSFYNTIDNLFKEYKYNIRIYIYSKEGSEVNMPPKDCVKKYYTDNRARKPYYIFRLASVELIKRWKEIVKEIISNNKYYRDVLRGFFAGEGNIKEGSHNSRTLRIAQKDKNKFVENILGFLNIRKFYFSPNERNYVIHGKWNWDIFAKGKLADLHPDKKERFWRSYNSYKEEHYENNYLRDNIFSILSSPHTTKELSKKYNRSFARIQDVLIDLKKRDKIRDFRVGSLNYWTNNSNLIIISGIKNKYLLMLKNPRRISEIAKEFKVNSKSSYRRLKELERLNLITRREDKRWIRKRMEKKIIVI
ncbi:hypothetical protein CMI42_00785 [Candidatus Pacearchaeota archaeon]|nr:hypothetical protein [Candidatus Pacearchaeota archaeon]